MADTKKSPVGDWAPDRGVEWDGLSIYPDTESLFSVVGGVYSPTITQGNIRRVYPSPVFGSISHNRTPNRPETLNVI